MTVREYRNIERDLPTIMANIREKIYNLRVAFKAADKALLELEQSFEDFSILIGGQSRPEPPNVIQAEIVPYDELHVKKLLQQSNKEPVRLTRFSEEERSCPTDSPQFKDVVRWHWATTFADVKAGKEKKEAVSFLSKYYEVPTARISTMIFNTYSKHIVKSLIRKAKAGK